MLVNLPPLNETLAPWLEDAWLQRYLDRELTEDEGAWFEAYALDKLRLIEAIDADTSLRDGLHSWHAEKQRNGTTIDDATKGDESLRVVSVIHAERATPGRRKAAQWYQPVTIAAGLVLAGFLGASAARWMSSEGIENGPISSPSRIVFDTLRGSDSAPLVERSNDAMAPLLIDVAVPAQATGVVAHFADHSSLALPISADGFVSLTGPRRTLLQQSPIRIAWQLAGQPQERTLDLKTTLARGEG